MPNPRIFPIPLVTDAGINVNAASTLVLAANTNRGDTDFTNLSDPSEAIFLARGNAAVMNAGIPLTARGSTYHIGTDNMFNGAIYAICASGDAILAISEGTAK